METTCLFFCVAALIFLILITIFGFVIYSGLFTKITPGAGPPPIKNVKIAYKFGRGPYKNVGPIFTEVCSLAPKLRCVGIYYDDPKRVPSEKLRWAVGTILAEGDQQPDEELVRLMCDKGFKTFGFPPVSNAVKCVFPFRSYLSVIIAIFRVYPLMGEFVKINKLCAHPYLEIYDGDILHFMAPLARQDEFYVPETSEEEGDEEEEEHEVEPLDVEPPTSGFGMQLRRRDKEGKGEEVGSKSKGKYKDEHEKIKIKAQEEKDRETSSKPKVTDSSGKRSVSEETSGAKGKSTDTTVQDSGISSTASLASSSGESMSPSPLRSGGSSVTSPGGTSASDGSATLSETSVLTTTTDASSLMMSSDADGMSLTSLGGSEGGGGTLSGFSSESNSDDAEPFEVIRKEDAQ